MVNHHDSFNLSRFVTAQENIYQQVVTELKNGKKRSHWMWFIFPQLNGLGTSSTSVFYSLKSLEEAQAYFQHPILGIRLKQCCQLLLSIEGRSVDDIFGFPDNQKLKSSMTLFSCLPDSEPIFEQVLAKFFQSKKDDKTLSLLKRLPDS